MNDISKPAVAANRQSTSGLDFPVVGIGASAGGLTALIKCFEQMPAAPDMAFVATFTVRLPLHERTDFGAFEPEANDEQTLAELRILLVDDSEDSLETFCLLLQTEGAIVTCAGSGTAALAACDHATFDLIISDIGMPDMDGTRLIAELRRRPKTEAIAAIALTGYGRPQDVQASMTAGFNAHLVKPADLRNLKRLALSLVRRSLATG